MLFVAGLFRTVRPNKLPHRLFRSYHLCCLPRVSMDRLNGLGYVAYPRLSTIASSSSSSSSSGINTAPISKEIIVNCKSQLDVEYLGEKLAETSESGDFLLLEGDLAAGKTSLARGFIRGMHGDPDMRVTSPSYLLDNVYEYEQGCFIHHIDLYRLPNSKKNLSILGIPASFQSTDSIYLIEWPERLGNEIPKEYLKVSIDVKYLENPDGDVSSTGGSKEHRVVRLTPIGDKWQKKLESLTLDDVSLSPRVLPNDPAIALAPYDLSVRPEWIDYNGHLNMAYYAVAFDQGVDKMFDNIGLGIEYLKKNEKGIFAAEAHTIYEREVGAADPLRIICHVLAADEKRIHVFLEMFHAKLGHRAATQELLFLHVDMTTRRVAPFPDHVRAKIDALVEHCSLLPPPRGIGRKISMSPPK